MISPFNTRPRLRFAPQHRAPAPRPRRATPPPASRSQRGRTLPIQSACRSGSVDTTGVGATRARAATETGVRRGRTDPGQAQPDARAFSSDGEAEGYGPRGPFGTGPKARRSPLATERRGEAVRVAMPGDGRGGKTERRSRTESSAFNFRNAVVSRRGRTAAFSGNRLPDADRSRRLVLFGKNAEVRRHRQVQEAGHRHQQRPDAHPPARAIQPVRAPMAAVQRRGFVSGVGDHPGESTRLKFRINVCTFERLTVNCHAFYAISPEFTKGSWSFFAEYSSKNIGTSVRRTRRARIAKPQAAHGATLAVSRRGERAK